MLEQGQVTMWWCHCQALCGDQDLIVDMEAAEETAAHFDQGKAVELKGMAHDLMLVGPCSTVMDTE